MPESLSGLVVEALRALEAGGDAALDAFLERHEASAPEVRARIESLRKIGLLEDPHAGPVMRDFPDRLGDFELLQRIGGGGMGVVYRARQTSLDREVALKLVRPEHLYFPGTRERFQREIQAVARLRHECIIQLYSVGEDSGVPYFAMEHVRGANLAEVVMALRGRRPQELSGEDLLLAVHEISDSGPPEPGAALPRLFEGSWVRACFRIAEHVAQALAHAHAEGILHRDLKPSNVMVTPGGRVVLMDFGLASTSGTQRITRTGAVLGSLHYMAPEVARGDARGCDERSDVYALGATLYELLALEAPFLDADAAKVQHSILHGSPPAISARNPAIPWDAETVCLVAMDRSPERRYPSATALQRDLRNFLDLRPIEARRPSTRLRLWRWAQRHPAASASLAVLTGVVLLGPGLLLVRERDTNTDLVQAMQRESAEAARARANLGLATSALDQILRRVADERLSEVPELAPWCCVVLDDAAGFFDQLLPHNVEDQQLRLGLAQALLRVGEVRRVLQDFDRARAAYSRADDLASRLSGVDPRAKALVGIDAKLGLAGIGRQLGQGPAAAATLLVAVADLRGLGGDAPDPDAEVTLRLAGALDSLASERTTQARLAEAERFGREAADLWRRILGLGTHTPEASSGLRRTAEQMAALAERRQNVAEAHHWRDLALETLEDAVLAHPEAGKPRSQLSGALAAAAHHAEVAGDLAQAERRWQAALAQANELVARFPGRVEFTLDVAGKERQLAEFLSRCGRSDEAATLLAPTVDRLRHLATSWPRSTNVRQSLLLSRRVLGEELDKLGRAEPAEAQWIALEGEVLELSGLAPDRAAAQETASVLHECIARRRLARGDHAAAKSHVATALARHSDAERLAAAQRISFSDRTPLLRLEAELLGSAETRPSK